MLCLISHGKTPPRVVCFQGAIDAGGATGSGTGGGGGGGGSSGVTGAEPLTMAGALFGLASTLDSQGVLPHRALQLLERSIELEPGRSPAHLLLGRTLAKLGRPSDAVRAFRSCIRLDPRAVDAFNELGYALLAAAAAGDAAAAGESDCDSGANGDEAKAADGGAEAPLDYSTGLVMDPVHVFKAAADLAPERNDLCVHTKKCVPPWMSTMLTFLFFG